MALPNVDRVVKDLTFSQDAYEDLPYDQRLKTNLVKYLLALISGWDSMQNEVIDIANSRLLDNANGPMLDGIAGRLFIERNGRSDEELRSTIKLFALKQTNQGTRDEIVQILQILTNTEDVTVVKKGNNVVKVTFPSVCLDVDNSKSEIEDLFPVNTNLTIYNKVSGTKHTGFGSVFDNTLDPNVGTFSSVFDSTSIQNENNSMATITISNEAGI